MRPRQRGGPHQLGAVVPWGKKSVKMRIRETIWNDWDWIIFESDSSSLCFRYNKKCSKFKHNNLFPKLGQLHVWLVVQPGDG